MTRDEFRAALRRELDDLFELLLEKSRKYAGDDPLKNFRKRGVAGGIVRVEDKLSRWDTFLEAGGATEEDWLETFGDIAGYAIMMRLWAQHGNDSHVLPKE